jgi:tRNA (guanine37-N1)-methyltransferase
MKFHVLTLFPEMFSSFASASILKRAIGLDKISIHLINFRDFTQDKYGRVDTPPIGGGAGLVLKAQPMIDALASVTQPSYTILLTPRGTPLTQQVAINLALKSNITLICGHYEGFDERIHKHVDQMISLGDFILTGGEIAAMAIIDSVTRLIPGVIDDASTHEESFNQGLLEYPQYTEPRVLNNDEVPSILYSGHHKAIEQWRRKQSLYLTHLHRPDLLSTMKLSTADQALLKEALEGRPSPLEIEAIEKGKKFTK